MEKHVGIMLSNNKQQKCEETGKRTGEERKKSRERRAGEKIKMRKKVAKSQTSLFIQCLVAPD